VWIVHHSLVIGDLRCGQCIIHLLMVNWGVDSILFTCYWWTEVWTVYHSLVIGKLRCGQCIIHLLLVNWGVDVIGELRCGQCIIPLFLTNKLDIVLTKSLFLKVLKPTNYVLRSDVTTFLPFVSVHNYVTDCPMQGGCSLTLGNYCSFQKRPSKIHHLSNNINFPYNNPVQFSSHPLSFFLP